MDYYKKFKESGLSEEKTNEAMNILKEVIEDIVKEKEINPKEEQEKIEENKVVQEDKDDEEVSINDREFKKKDIKELFPVMTKGQITTSKPEKEYEEKEYKETDEEINTIGFPEKFKEELYKSMSLHDIIKKIGKLDSRNLLNKIIRPSIKNVTYKSRTYKQGLPIGEEKYHDIVGSIEEYGKYLPGTKYGRTMSEVVGGRTEKTGNAGSLIIGLDISGSNYAQTLIYPFPCGRLVSTIVFIIACIEEARKRRDYFSLYTSPGHGVTLKQITIEKARELKLVFSKDLSITEYCNISNAYDDIIDKLSYLVPFGCEDLLDLALALYDAAIKYNHIATIIICGDFGDDARFCNACQMFNEIAKLPNVPEFHIFHIGNTSNFSYLLTEYPLLLSKYHHALDPDKAFEEGLSSIVQRPK